MRTFFSRPRSVFIASIVYWLLLALGGLGPALVAGWRAAGAPGTHSSINVSAGDGAITLSVTNQGATTYSANIHWLALALWVAVPPLVFWALWFVAQGRRRAAVAAQ